MGHGGVVAHVACNALISVDQLEASITNIGQSEAIFIPMMLSRTVMMLSLTVILDK